MKKMNNKGFAISTLLYGLMLVAFLVVALLMSIMSTNRKNTSTLIKKIEEELNRYSQTTTEIISTGSAQEFIVPYGKAGWYKIELWGAKSGINNLGSYTSGIVFLEENEHIYFHIGETGSSTDVRLSGGEKNDLIGITSRIMYANGGSDSGSSYIKGYSSTEPHANTTETTKEGIKKTFGFINGLIQEGVNSGGGRATIELVSTNSKDNPPTKKNNNLNNVRYIKDCVKGTYATTAERWKEIQAFDSSGINLAAGKTVKYSDGTVITGLTDYKLDNITSTKTITANISHCVTLDLGGWYDLEEIAIYHNFASSEKSKYKSETISVSSNGSSYTTVKGWDASARAPYETENGIRISARNLITEPVISGNYYIQPFNSEKMAITTSGTSAILSFNNGAKSQRWAISSIEGGKFKIVEASQELALQPAELIFQTVSGETRVTTKDQTSVGTNNIYKGNKWEKWIIEPVKDLYFSATKDNKNGYYRIKSAVDGVAYCLGITKLDRDSPTTMLQMQTCGTDNNLQWFKLINADY